jgi:hypothetical protein
MGIYSTSCHNLKFLLWLLDDHIEQLRKKAPASRSSSMTVLRLISRSFLRDHHLDLNASSPDLLLAACPCRKWKLPNQGRRKLL